MSSRTDGRGHWPAGRRRSDASAALRRRALAAIRRAINRDGYSINGVARVLGVSDRTVRRWLAEEDWPTAAAAQEAAERFPARRRA